MSAERFNNHDQPEAHAQKRATASFDRHDPEIINLSGGDQVLMGLYATERMAKERLEADPNNSLAREMLDSVKTGIQERRQEMGLQPPDDSL